MTSMQNKAETGQQQWINMNLPMFSYLTIKVNGKEQSATEKHMTTRLYTSIN